ncbi:MAG: AAA family ATPase, partial [Actinomycetota bacterium]
MAASIVGLPGEIAAVAAFIDDAQPSPSGLLVEGEAGIGKTTLWREGVRMARALGRRVLVAQPSKSEASLPYGALADLVEGILPVGDATYRDTLEAALSGRESDRLGVSRAVLGLMQTLSAEGPFVVALDDVQWLDAPSEAVLAFVVRRVSHLPVRVLATRRSDDGHPPPLGLDRAFDERIGRLRIGPMPLGDLDRLVRDRLGLRLARPRLTKLHHAAGGNPFYALEIARSLQADDGDDTVPVPSHVGAAVEARLSALPEEARDAVLLVSACLHPSVSLVERSAGGTAGLTQAIEAGVLQIDRERLRFTHPLLASVGYESAAPWARREAHARLASAAEDPLERAHHLSRATTEPDEGVAAELQDAAVVARARGASDLAADLSDHASRLTPPGSVYSFQRAITAAQQRVAAGDPTGARARLQKLVDVVPPGVRRARVLSEIADIDGYPMGVELGLRALDEARDDPGLQCEIHLLISTLLWNHGEIDRFLEHLRAAVALSEAAGDASLLAMSMAELVETETLIGLPLRQERVEHLLELDALAQLGLATYMRPMFRLGCALCIT